MEVVTALGEPLPSPARTRPSRRAPFRVGAVQLPWHPDPDAHRAALAEGIEIAAELGAELVCLQELTLSPYLAASGAGAEHVPLEPESVEAGSTVAFAKAMAARCGCAVHASLWEADPAVAPRGYNTAVCVGPDGALLARTRKLHIPVTAGYHEDRYFAEGDTGFPVVPVGDARLGFPTCWDQWFPEVARAYSLAGAEVLVYPTAIGSEPDHPGFDTQPLWQQVITAHGITSGTFMVAVNRTGTERLADLGYPGAPPIRFYGSSFISDPYGRVLVQAPRDVPAVLVADLDLDARRDWLELFPMLTTRRPDAYGPLTVSQGRSDD
jgi:N-carbamoylputrescine amidase